MSSDEEFLMPYKSLVDPSYSSGKYFSDGNRGAPDAVYKARWVLDFLKRIQSQENIQIESYADVGCGSGENIRLIREGLLKRGGLKRVCGYDVSPHVIGLHAEGIEFFQQDFCQVKERYDLVTLLDVFEHVSDPAGFIRAVSSRASLVVFHIPLDDCFLNRFRDEFRKKLKNPGHLIYLNPVSALNLIAFSGLRILDYTYTFAFEAPSGCETFKQKMMFPLRRILAAVNPYLLASTLGGVSLLVGAVTLFTKKQHID